MNELWIIGIIGGGAGAAVGAPLIVGRNRADQGWTTERLIGLWLLGAATAMTLIAVRHGGLLSPFWADMTEHLTNALSLMAWPFLVSLARRIGGTQGAWPRTLADHLIPGLAYLAVVAALRIEDVRFIWLMPAGVLAVLAIGAVWRMTRDHQDAVVRRRLSALFGFSLVFVVAQGARSLAPQMLAIREVVPAVTTLAIFGMAFALVGGRTLLDAPARQYARSGLSADRAARLAERLDAAMRSERWYRETDLTLVTLARRLGTSPQVISQALNQQRGQSLNEYLTAWRVPDAKVRLGDPSHDFITVAGVARRSGFASRSAFYKAFRDAEGMTPAEFRERRSQGQPTA